MNKPFSFVSVLQILFYIQRQPLPLPSPARVSIFIPQVPENPVAQVSFGVTVMGATQPEQYNQAWALSPGVGGPVLSAPPHQADLCPWGSHHG